MSSDSSRRLAACVAALQDYLEAQSAALLKMAREPWLVAARDTEDRDEEDRLLSVMEEVDALAPQATDTLSELLLGRLKGPDAAARTAEEAADDAGLALVETAEVDDWLRLRGMLERQTDGARAVERGLWARLAAHAGVAADPDQNPVALQTICSDFQAAMQGLGPGRDARGAIYDAFEATLVANLNHLAARLDTLLDEDLPEDVGSDHEATQPHLRPLPAAEESPALARPLPEAAADVPVDPTRMLGAMAGVQRREVEQPPAAGLDDLEERLLEAIAPGPGVVLDERERGTVAAVARLVRSIVEDPQVDPAVQRRLSHLAPPLLMLALQDEGYLEAEMHAARHDPVTGLLDRAAFRTRLEAAFRAGRRVAVCLVDVDGFDQVATRFDHQVGGRLLRALADLLRKQAGAKGVVARLRGDEFAVLLVGAKAGAARRFAERYLKVLAGSRFVFGGEGVALGASIGAVESDAGLDSPAAVMQAADISRNAAKAAGGGRAHVHGTAAAD